MDNNEKINSKDIIDLIPLDSKTDKLAEEIIKEDDLKKVQDLTHLFNLQLAKKNVLRVLKLNSLLDKVSDQMIERFEKRPGEFSNADLLNYLTVTQNAIDRANKSLNLVDETPAITMNQLNVNLVENNLDRDSREKITEAVKKILEMSKKMDIINDQDTQNLIIEEPKEIKTEDYTVINKDNNLLNGEEE